MPTRAPHPDHGFFKAVACIFCMVGLSACSLPNELGQAHQPALPPSAVSAPSAPLVADASHYRVDADASTLHILVFRGGSMARLGHNHVISSRSLRGGIWRGTALEQSGFEITVPVNALIVDDNAARAEEGTDFPLNIGEDAKQGTKANMLRPSLLDGDQYPDISIRSVGVSGSPGAPEVLAAIRIKDQTREVRVPVTLQERDGGLQVEGAFELRQTDFGITPLSIALGALQVVDSVKIKFRLVATQRPAAM